MCHRGLQKQDLYVDKYFLDILNKADVCTLPASPPPSLGKKRGPCLASESKHGFSGLQRF